MTDNQQKFFTGFLTALGAVAAFFGVRALMQRMQLYRSNQDHQARVQRRFDRSLQGQRSNEQPIGYVPQSQPDRQPLPVTGAEETAALDELVMSVPNQVRVSDQVEPLMHYLLSFNDVMEMLRAQRQRSASPGRVITPDMRALITDTLDLLDDQIPEYSYGNLEEGSLQERIYRLIVKIRDAMQSIEYTADDLFRINGEIHAEACQILDEIQAAGEGAVLDFSRVREAYGCE